MESGLHGVSGHNALLLVKVEGNPDFDNAIHPRLQGEGNTVTERQLYIKAATQINAPVIIYFNIYKICLDQILILKTKQIIKALSNTS